MKALFNPLLFVTCILLLAVDYASVAAGETGSAALETWVLTLCLLGVVINGTLGVARAMTQRPSLPGIGWAVTFLIFGSVVWALVSAEQVVGVSAQERILLRERVAAWRAGELSPYEQDAHGDSVVTLAAGLGREEILSELLKDPAARTAHAGVLVRAAHRAAERNREQTLRLLLAAGVPVDARLEGMTLLQTASLNRARRTAALLLEQGASVHAAEGDAAPPLHNAVLADDVEMVRLLLQHGANPAQADADGRDAASYAHREVMLEALAPTPAKAGSAQEAP